MVVKRTYNVPLRKEFQKAPFYKRSKKAMAGLIAFLKKHMKTDVVKIGKNLNDEIWANGIRNPPHHVEVVVIKDDEGVARAELAGFEKEIEPKAEEKKEAKKKAPAKAAAEEKSEDLEEALEKAEEKKAE